MLISLLFIVAGIILCKYGIGFIVGGVGGLLGNSRDDDED